MKVPGLCILNKPHLSINSLYLKYGHMRNIYLIIIVLLGWITSAAKDVSKDYAQQVARNFYLYNVGNTQAAGNLRLAYTAKTKAGVGRISDDKPVYYVFDAGSENGFVIVSGEDMVMPVLGYSSEGHYTLEDLPQALAKWMGDSYQQIVFVKENRHETTEEIRSLWDSYYNNTFSQVASRGSRAVTPLCATKWNQSPNENGLCPYDAGYGQRAVTGCVATAMSQVMKFWNYPTQGTGFHSYNDQKYGTQTANFGNTTYNWAGMPNVLSSANANVATLMYHCGVAVDMGYGVGATGGSSAYVVASLSPVQACAEYAYKTYFGYDPASVRGVVRDNYTQAQWINLLKTELNAGRPVQYAGIGNGGGHTWVCDGFDQNDFMHMNWGWGGNSDGYFSVNNLDPASLGAGGGTGGFNTKQQAVIGIKPLTGGGGGGGGTGTINPDGIKLYSALTVNSNPIQTGSQLEVYAQIANGTGAAFSGDVAAALFDIDGVFVGFIQQYTNQAMQSNFYYNYTFTLSNLAVVPGQYYIGIYYKTGGNNYSLIDAATFYNPASITVVGPYNAIQMNSATTPAKVVKGQSFSIQNQMKNVGSNFSGWLSADLYKLDGTYVTNVREVSGINMQANNNYNVTFNSTGLTVDPGTYYLAFFSSADHNNWTLVYNQAYPNPVKVTVTEEALNPDMYENNNTQAAAYALPVNFTGNNATVSTQGSNMHIGNDYDYYKLNLPSGTNYAITARVHDAYNSSNGNNYSNDVQFSYSVNGASWGDGYDDIMPGSIFVPGGGTVSFFVADYFTGSTGSYLLDLQIARGANVAVNETEELSLSVFPNPASGVLYIATDEKQQGEYCLRVVNLLGATVKELTGTIANSLIKADISGISSGLYSIRLQTGNSISKAKVIVE
jgi:hypothetical protein